MMLAIISFLLIVQGTGVNGKSPVAQIGQPYVTESACKEDGETLSRTLSMKFVCLPVKSDR